MLENVDVFDFAALKEAAGDDWQLAESPEPLRVRAGQWLEVAVEFIAHEPQAPQQALRSP